MTNVLNYLGIRPHKKALFIYIFKQKFHIENYDWTVRSKHLSGELESYLRDVDVYGQVYDVNVILTSQGITLEAEVGGTVKDPDDNPTYKFVLDFAGNILDHEDLGSTRY